MTDLSPSAPRSNLVARIALSIPVIGWIARDLLHGDKNNIWFFIVAIVSLWGISILTWGVPGLYLPALGFVPVMWIILLLITRG